jgi:hypothetical protein
MQPASSWIEWLTGAAGCWTDDYSDIIGAILRKKMQR